MEISKEAIPVLRNLDEAKELIDKLSIEDLRNFCFTFGLSQEGTKANLKERLMWYYRDQFSPKDGSPVPAPRKRSLFTSLTSILLEGFELSDAAGCEFEENKSDVYEASSVEQHLHQADDRIDRIEVWVKRMNTYVEESLAIFRISLTEVLMESTEKMMQSFSELTGYSKKEKEHE